MNTNISVAFDVDGTLIHLSGEKEDTPRYDVIALLRIYESLGCMIYIWSGGGVDYAEQWARKLGLEHIPIAAKGSFIPEISVDDEEVKLGKVNLKV